MELVEVVLLGDFDGQTVGMVASEASVAALGCLSGPAMQYNQLYAIVITNLPIVITDETEHALDVPDVLGLSGEGDVVVDELAPGDQEDRHSVVVEALVLIGVKVIVIFLHIDKLFAFAISNICS